MKKGMILTLLFLLLCFTNYAFASYSLSLDGRPDAFNPGHSNGYFIWQDKKGLHLRITTSGTKHVFSGTIHTDGTFEDAFEKSRGADDDFHINNDRDKITFKFTTSGEVDSIDLHVYDGSYVRFNLSMDGDDINPSNIFIGSNGWHPGSHKFTLFHDEDSVKYSTDPTVIIAGDFYWWHFPDYWGPPDWGPGRHGHWRH